MSNEQHRIGAIAAELSIRAENDEDPFIAPVVFAMMCRFKRTKQFAADFCGIDRTMIEELAQMDTDALVRELCILTTGMLVDDHTDQFVDLPLLIVLPTLVAS